MLPKQDGAATEGVCRFSNRGAVVLPNKHGDAPMGGRRCSNRGAMLLPKKRGGAPMEGAMLPKERGGGRISGEGVFSGDGDRVGYEARRYRHVFWEICLFVLPCGKVREREHCAESCIVDQ